MAMITKIEMEYMEAVKTIAREMRRANSEQSAKEPDWEQRRYEVARELFSALVNKSGETDYKSLKSQAFSAVVGADALIKELIEIPLPQYYGEKGK